MAVTSPAIPPLPGRGELWRRPLPHQPEAVTRGLCRGVLALAGGRVVSIEGLEHIAPERDPFVLVANHSQRLEAVLVPTLLIFHRGGKPIHFLADWPMRLVPLVGWLYRRSRVITVLRKDARPRWLNVLRPLFDEPGTAFERAAARLRQGASVGIFPEGTMNRDPRRLLRGRPGATRLALDTGVPVVPVGIRFPDLEAEGRQRPIRDLDRMAITIGPALTPPTTGDAQASRRRLRDFHLEVMSALARLSGKSFVSSSLRTPKSPNRLSNPIPRSL